MTTSLMSSLAISETSFAFLDTETTGLSPARGDRVCEIAVLKTRGGAVIESFQSLINPQRPIDLGAQAIHGISDAMVAKSPRFGDLAERLAALLDDSVLVCHNIPFDKGFIEAEFRRTRVSLPAIPELDTLKLARKYFSFSSNRLGAIAGSLGVAPEGWHRAGNDVAMLRAVFERFLPEFQRKGARTLGCLLKL